MDAIGMHIFGGSQTIGHLLEGWKVDTILEMTDDMISQNSYHFIRNYPNISIKLPYEYVNNELYLNELKQKNYDLLFANPPCSGLSAINRNASVDNAINHHLYDVINTATKIKPKVFFIENAPTLTTLGLPILKDIANKIKDDFKLLIINDCAKNHSVSMHRRRTFVIGFNKKYFKDIPKIDTYENEKLSVKDILNTVDYTYNKELTKDSNPSLFKYYGLIKENQSLFRALAENSIDIEELPGRIKNDVQKIKYKLDNNLNIWDKSPWRPKNDGLFPSLTSLTRIIHPTENRDLYVREYAAIMGYPDDFKFYTSEEDTCKLNPVQCIAQGVPVNFIRYISKEIMKSFNAKEYISGDVVYINQCNPKNIKINIFNTVEDFTETKTIIGG